MNLQEHAFKEMLKKIVDNSPNYPHHVKEQVKLLIDAGKSPEDICEKVISYMSALPIIWP